MDARIISSPTLLLWIVLASAIGWLVNIVVKGWKVRSIFVELQRQDLVIETAFLFPISTSTDPDQPMPKHSLLFGHLLAIKPYVDKLPSDAHGFITFGQMARKYSGGIFYLDMWPFIGPIMICTSVTAAVQATQKTVLAARKPTSLYAWFYSIAGGPNLFTMPEDEWKGWRKIFNPGFSQTHLLRLVPDIVHETRAYRDLLKEYAEADAMFSLDEATLWFTMDLIGAIVLCVPRHPTTWST